MLTASTLRLHCVVARTLQLATRLRDSPCTAMQTYTSMQQKKAELQKQMSLKVYDISLDAQEGVLFSILDEMSDQYVKEMLLAYFILYKHNEPLTGDELDTMCEDFLEDKFDVKIDFAMDDSLPRLLQTGLVRKSALDGSFKAAPLQEANDLLMLKWNRYCIRLRMFACF